MEDVLRKRWETLEESVRRSPTAAILIAAGAGYCLHRLPLRSILATQFKLLWALAPPGLLAAAATKAYQVMEERSGNSGNGESKDGDSNASVVAEGPKRRRAATSHE